MRLQYFRSRWVRNFGRALTAFLCVVFILLGGTLAVNPVWHESLHDHQSHDQCPGPHSNSPAPDSPEATCVVCIFAHHQVTGGSVISSPVLPPDRAVVSSTWRPASACVEGVWPEPAGRGPPV